MAWLLASAVLILTLQSEVLAVCKNHTAAVTTTAGRVVGCQVSGVFEGKTYKWREYLGIPYAAPPVGQRRFKKPVAVKPWFETLIATQFGKKCVQFETTIEFSEAQGEDCLTLNLFVPSTATHSLKKSVMVFVHGGSFASGSSQDYNGAILSSLGDVILVTLNYRLGPLGFLTTGDGIVPGNMGIWDVLEALKWLHKNLVFFGGDPQSVTLFGESAGAMLESNLLTSTYIGSNLIQRAIMQSGSYLFSVVMQGNKETPALSRSIAGKLNCSYDNGQDMLSCLQNIPIKSIRDKTLEEFGRFLPITDGQLLTEDSCDTVVKFREGENIPMGNIAKFDVMVGHNSQEGLLFSWYLNALSLALEGKNISDGLSETMYERFLNRFVGSLSSSEDVQRELLAAVRTTYEQRFAYLLANRTESERRLKWATEIGGDVLFVWPTIATAILHQRQSTNRKTYLYVFDHKRTEIPAPWYEGPDWLRVGASHADELVYIFGFPILMGMQGPARDLSLAMISYWTKFAKSGNPSTSWPRFTTAQEYVTITAGGLTRDTRPSSSLFDFWTDIHASGCLIDVTPTLATSSSRPTSMSTTRPGIVRGLLKRLQAWLWHF